MFDTLKDFIVAIAEIVIISFVVYKLIKLVSDTRAWQLLKGVVFLLLIAWIASLLELKTISYLLSGTFQILAFAIVVVFQDELKKILERVGNSNLKYIFNEHSQNGKSNMIVTIENIVSAVATLSKTNTGALIVIERDIKLGEIIATGVTINSRISKELLEQIFVPNTPLHDGAVVIREDCIMAASCILPLTSNVNLSKELGTRHRAAIGMSEISDCISVIVSEETGKISVTMEGKIRRGFDEESLTNFLKNALAVEEKKSKKRLFSWKGKQK